MRIAQMEQGNRIRLPAEWVTELGLESAVVLVKTPESILVRPISHRTWDEVFADKLTVGQIASESSGVEISSDDRPL